MGALDATVNQGKASEYEVRGYPTIKMFAAGKKGIDSVEEYNGGRTSGDIVNWALEKLADSVEAPELSQVIFFIFSNVFNYFILLIVLYFIDHKWEINERDLLW